MSKEAACQVVQALGRAFDRWDTDAPQFSPDWCNKLLVDLLHIVDVNECYDGVQLIIRYLKKCPTISEDVLQAFLNGKVNLGVQDEKGRTPLSMVLLMNKKFCQTSRHQKASKCQSHNLANILHGDMGPFGMDTHVVQMLMKNGADPRIEDNEGYNSMHLAIRDGATKDQLDVFFKSEFEVDLIQSKSSNNETIVYSYLANVGFMDFNLSLFRYLMTFGIDINTKNSRDGTTALHVMLNNLHSWDDYDRIDNVRRRIQLMIKHSARIDIGDDEGVLPLSYAIKNKAPLASLYDLIPKKKLMNDDSIWDGSLIDEILSCEGGDEATVLDTVTNLINQGLESFPEDLLTTVFKNSGRSVALLELLIVHGDFEIDSDVLQEFLKLNTSPKTNIASIALFLFTQFTAGREEFAKLSPFVLVKLTKFLSDDGVKMEDEVFELVKLLIEDYKFDVNLIHNEYGALIHNVIKMCMEARKESDQAVAILDYILQIDRLNIDFRINHVDCKSRLSPLEFCFEVMKRATINLQLKARIAERLVVAFASVTSNNFRFIFKFISRLFDVHKMIGIIGYEYDWDELRDLPGLDGVQRLRTWLENYSSKPRTLAELAAMSVRKNLNRQQIIAWKNSIELPDSTIDVLLLKHIDFSDKPSSPEPRKRRKRKREIIESDSESDLENDHEFNLSLIGHNIRFS